MYAFQTADSRMIVLYADWPLDQVRKRLIRARKDDISTAVVLRDGDEPAYFLLPVSHIRTRLEQAANPDLRLDAALELAYLTPTPAVDAYTPGYIAGPAVLVDKGRPVGFIPPPVFALEMGGEFEGDAVYEMAAAPPLEAAPPESRSLTASLAEQVPLHQETPLTVTLSAPGVAMAGALPVAVAAGSLVDLLVQPMDDTFQVVGNNMDQLTAGGGSSSQTFTLKAMKAGLGKVRVFAFQDGLPLGYLTVAAQAITTSAPVIATRTDAEAELSPPGVKPPDLSMVVLEQKVGNETEITILISAVDPALGLNLKRFGPVRLRVNPKEYFQEFFKDIERLPLDTERDEERAVRRLAAKGNQLFESLFPPDLQALLWGVRERIQKVQIQSEEPWIPWELCKLQGREDGRIVEGPFLCEAFAVTRWMPGVGQRHLLSLNKIALIVPEDSGLTYARDELEFMLSLANGRTVEEIPANYLDVTDALAAGEYDGLHFSGHGVFRAADPNHSGMELEDGDRLVPEDLSGAVRNLGAASPLVFLNACQLGRGGMSLTDMGGWAARFLEAGAGAFVGAYWNVYDESAFNFAKELYTRLLDGESMGAAVHGARLAARDIGDPSWLAYTAFAHPEAKLRED
jgi:hypothetical protein